MSHQTNPIYGLFHTCMLFLHGRVTFLRQDEHKTICMADGQNFRVFRHVVIKTDNPKPPEAVFIVRFRPARMSINQNIRFSRLPMMIFMGFGGFREKYWCVDDSSGLCQGVYFWQQWRDAKAYAASIAMRFMTQRSDPNLVSACIVRRTEANFTLLT